MHLLCLNLNLILEAWAPQNPTNPGIDQFLLLVSSHPLSFPFALTCSLLFSLQTLRPPEWGPAPQQFKDGQRTLQGHCALASQRHQ